MTSIEENFKSRPLTKSRFKTGLECPRKLYYGGMSNYANQQLDDPFLESLAEGGFQVGELAKAYFLGGIDIETLDYDEALAETNELLQREHVVIYEAAIRYQDLFIRVDVLEKKGNSLFLHEVKAKSIGANPQADFVKKCGSPKSNWKPYLYDIAFQKHVVQKAFPDSHVFSYLMLVDKTVRPTTSGLNQKIQVVTEDGRKKAALVEPLSQQELAEKLLKSVSVDAICDDIYKSTNHRDGEVETFSALVTRLSEYSLGNIQAQPSITTACGNCEFYRTEKDGDLKDGRAECISTRFAMTQEELVNTPLIFDLWNYRQKQRQIDQGVIRIADLHEEDIGPDPCQPSLGLNTKQRQWLQVEKIKNHDQSAWVDEEGLSGAVGSWRYPLNFIDFETTRVALPFHEGQQPYEAVAFQYSLHVLHEDGRLEHRAQYLNAEPGVFPNFEFLRSLKSHLSENDGSIFCYSHHENSILNAIKEQLENSQEADKDSLIEFVQQIAKPKTDSKDHWEPCREMVDMLEVVKRYLYLPTTHGSNSIKYVLPAILADSKALTDKYSQPIYRDHSKASSLNFPSDWLWLQGSSDPSQLDDPYKHLPPIFDDYGHEVDERLAGLDNLDNGGAALTAYAKLQFEDLSTEERERIQTALLKYCELDTLAMVMLYQYLKGAA